MPCWWCCLLFGRIEEKTGERLSQAFLHKIAAQVRAGNFGSSLENPIRMLVFRRPFRWLCLWGYDYMLYIHIFINRAGRDGTGQYSNPPRTRPGFKKKIPKPVPNPSQTRLLKLNPIPLGGRTGTQKNPPHYHPYLRPYKAFFNL